MFQIIKWAPKVMLPGQSNRYRSAQKLRSLVMICSGEIGTMLDNHSFDIAVKNIAPTVLRVLDVCQDSGAAVEETGFQRRHGFIWKQHAI